MTNSDKGHIFISYRRADTQFAAGRIYDRLAAHFGKDAIFMDVDTIEAGVDFVDVLQNAVQSCDVLVPLMGRQWLNIKDADGKRRLDNPEDFVRVEIAAALGRDIRVIPVLVDGAPLPRSMELPDNLMPLARRNALQVNHHSFNADARRLISQLELALSAAEERRRLENREQEEREAAERARKEREAREKVAADERANLAAAQQAQRKREERERIEAEEKARKGKEEREREVLPAARVSRTDSATYSPELEKPAHKPAWLPYGIGGVIILIVTCLIFSGNYLYKAIFAPYESMPTKDVQFVPLQTPATQSTTMSLLATYTPTKAECEIVIVTVQENDTLFSISLNYAVPMDVIIDYNELSTDVVSLGQSLQIPLCERVSNLSLLKPSLNVGSTMISEEDGMVMVYVPDGEFQMGSEDGYSNEKPVHTVYLDAFWIDQTEVTNAMYAGCVDAGACDPPSSTESYTRDSYYGNSEFDDYPVIYVTWDDGKAYCEWAGRRLPSEAEWEKAAVWDEDAGTQRVYPWGNAFDGTKTNFCDTNCPFDWKNTDFDDGFQDTAPTGNYEGGKSFYGAYDMEGNVLEWVADWYASDYYASSPSSNPTGPDSGSLRVLRGGSWLDSVDFVRSANRVQNGPTLTSYAFGFRCARDAD